MHKKLNHLIFIFVLAVISFKHYQFAKLDQRTSIDFHEYLYCQPALDYYYTLEGASVTSDSTLYAKALGFIMKVCGKNYFVQRLSYLLFFLLYLTAFYLAVTLFCKSYAIGLFSVILHVSIPGVISYSRMCWPHIYSGAFIFFSIAFLWMALKRDRYCYCFYGLALLSMYIAKSIYYSSMVYILMILVWFAVEQRRHFLRVKILLKLFCFIVLFAFITFFFFLPELKMMLIQCKTGNYMSLYSYTEYVQLYLNPFHWWLYLFFLAISFFVFLFRDSTKEKLHLSAFVLFLLFNIAASGFRYPPHVLVMGIAAGCVFIARFIVSLKYVKLRVLTLGLIAIFAMLLNCFPSLFITPVEANMYFYKIGIIPDNRDWGRKELKSWLNQQTKDKLKIAVLAQPFYPTNGTNYLQVIDIDLMSDRKQIIYLLRPDDFYDEPNLTYVNSLSTAIISDKKINMDKFFDAVVKSGTDYLIVDEINKPYYWLFANKIDAARYNVFRKRLSLASEPYAFLDYRSLSDKLMARLYNSFSFYVDDIGNKHKYTEGYEKLNKFLKKSIVLKEVKRIKCPVKDIVIYAIEK